MLADQGADAIYLEPDIHAVGDRLLVVVLHEQVMIEEAESLYGRCGSQADSEGIEIFQHLPPQVVDGTMAFVGDDEVEGLDGKGGVIGDRDRLVLEQGGFKTRLLLQFRVDFLSLQHCVETLNSGDANLADIIELV